MHDPKSRERWLRELESRAETTVCELDRGNVLRSRVWAESIVRMAKDALVPIAACSDRDAEPVPPWLFGHYETLFNQQRALIDQLQSELRVLRTCRKVDDVRRAETWGVWNAAIADWVNDGQFSEHEARKIAADFRQRDLNRQYGYEARPRPAEPLLCGTD